MLLNLVLISILFIYIWIRGLSANVSCFLIYLKHSWISDIEYDPSCYSNLSFYVESDILNLTFLFDFMFFHV